MTALCPLTWNCLSPSFKIVKPLPFLRTPKARRYFAAAIGVLALSLCASTMPAHAAEVTYNQTTPGFNGTSYSPVRYKVVEDLRGEIWSSSVGGNYQLDAGMSANNSGAPLVYGWARIDDGTYGTLPNFYAVNASVHLAISSDLTTPVSVNAIGTWDAH